MTAESETTIAAVSTAYGEGGIGIVRISGQDAGRILARVFVRGGVAAAAGSSDVMDGGSSGRNAAAPAARDGGDGPAGGGNAADFEDRHMYYGHVVSPGGADEDIATVNTARENGNAAVAGEMRASGEDVPGGAVIDEALAVFMRGPRTYTGEDVAEIHCHGSVVSLRRTLDAVLDSGAEPASPGEFTQRAFLNGRLDLAQAEAVIDIIRAKTERSASAAVAQLGGGLSGKVNGARALLADALALAAIHIDYPDDDKDFRDDDSAQARMAASLRAATSQISALMATAESGRILREGLNLVIAGAANAGKSSLMNALLKESRAIVTATPGTTRDSIEEQADIKGIPVRITDTAGIRETDNEIEQMGIERALAALADADLVVFLVDGSKEIDEGDVEALRVTIEETGAGVAIAVSKSDLPQVVTDQDIEYMIEDATHAEPADSTEPTTPTAPAAPHPNAANGLYTISENSGLYTIGPSQNAASELYTIGSHIGTANILYTIRISAETGEGIAQLEAIIENSVYGGAAPQGDEPLVTNARHKNLLSKAMEEAEAAERELAASGNIDLAETNIRAAYDHLGELTGETATDDILDRVFSRFCVGK